MLSIAFPRVSSQDPLAETFYALDPSPLIEAGFSLPENINSVHFKAGYGPSEATLLLPFKVIKRLTSLPHDPTDLSTLNYRYDNVILIQTDGNVIHTSQEWDWGIPELATQPSKGAPFLRTSGWFFLDSYAVDPSSDSEADEAAHVANFVDIRGVESFIGGTPGQNLNVATGVGPPHIDYNYEQAPYPYPAYTWENATIQLWRNVARPHLTKFDDPPLGFEYPEITPGNPHPINLEFQNMSAWEAFVSYVHKMSHEIFPNVDGTFRVAPIHKHTYVAKDGDALVEMDVDDDDPQLTLKLRLGPEIVQHIDKMAYVSIDSNLNILPYSFVGVFSRSPWPGETIVFPPVYFYRSSWNQDTTQQTNLKDQQTTDSLFTEVLLDNTDFFPSTFLDHHGHILDTLGADSDSQNDDDALQDLHDKYVDMTFCWAGKGNGEHSDFELPLLGNDGKAVTKEDIRYGHDGTGLRSGHRDVWGAAFYGNNNYGPTSEDDKSVLARVGQKVCRWHLRTLMYGDFGNVILHGWPIINAEDFSDDTVPEEGGGGTDDEIPTDGGPNRPIMPNTRHQSVNYKLDPVSGPLLDLYGAYTHNGPYTRSPIHRPFATDDSHSLAVVVTVADASSDATGITGSEPHDPDDFEDYEQGGTTGTALLLDQESLTLWRPDDPNGDPIALDDMDFEFTHIRSDADIRVGSIIRVYDIAGNAPVGLPSGFGTIYGTPVSPVDYLKGLPDYDEGVSSTEQIVWKDSGGGYVHWVDASTIGSGGTPGPPGTPGAPGAPGPTYTSGCGIIVAGTVIHIDLAELFVSGGGLIQSTGNDGTTSCTFKVNPLDLAGCGLIAAADNQADADGPVKIKFNPLAVEGLGLKADSANTLNAAGPCKIGLFQTDYDNTKIQFYNHTSGTFKWRTFTVGTLKIPTSIELNLVSNTLQVKLNYTEYEIPVLTTGATGSLTDTVSTVNC